ncbi:MAG: hypothetical protein WD037_13200 [Balneolales bacterium]
MKAYNPPARLDLCNTLINSVAIPYTTTLNPKGKMRDWSEYIFDPPHNFEEKALHVFDHQFYHNCHFHNFCRAMECDTGNVNTINGIPLLPMEAFRDAAILGKYVKEPELIFKSSGTTSMKSSVHYVAAVEMYRKAILEGLMRFYNLDDLVFWGYVPGYSDNPNSSLIWMINHLIDQDDSDMSRFLPLGEELDVDEISDINDSGKQLLIFGAAFGFLDLLKEKKYILPENTIIMETGGMKTHRRQISREALHKELANGYGLKTSQIHSEYGMTELLSQSYATGGSWYKTPPWLHVTIRDPENPMTIMAEGEEGLIGIIDLANVHSCSFLLTQDVGVQNGEGDFKVKGRWRYSNLRGCNFLVEEE